MIDAGERRPSMHELDDRDAQRTSAPADEGDVDLDETVVGGEALERLAEPHPAGSNVGRYVILERVGQGGMGVVYAAFDPELNRRVALKLLHAAKRSGTGHQGPPRARLLREAQAIARVSHPNVISVFDTGTLGDAVFVAME
jgi:serine/threonine protein kinase